MTDITDGAAYLALRAGVCVVPVGIAGAERLMPRGAVLPRPGRVRIVIGEPIEPSDAAARLAAAAGGEAAGGSGDGRNGGGGGGLDEPALRVPSPSARIPRSVTKELTEKVRAGIGAAFERAEEELAQRRRGRPHETRRTGAAGR